LSWWEDVVTKTFQYEYIEYTWKKSLISF
jgi:hypothetical protein